MNLYSIPQLIGAGLTFSLIIFVYLQTNQGKNKHAYLFLLFCLVTFVWQTCYCIAYNMQSEAMALAWLKLGYTGVVLMPITSVHFTTSNFLARRSRLTEWIVRSGYVLAFIFLFLLHFTDYFVEGTFKYFWGYYPDVYPPVHLAYIVLCFTPIPYAYWLIFQEWRRIEKQGYSDIEGIGVTQLQLILFAYMSITSAVVDFLPNYGIEVYPFGATCVVIFGVVMAYTILRYNLYDVRVIMTRIGIFTAVYIVVGGIPFVMSLMGRAFLENLLADNWWTIPLAINTVLASMSPFVFSTIWRRTEGVLRRQLEQKEIEASSDDLTGLLVRRAFQQKAQAALAEALQKQQTCSLLMIDLDHFKQKNDTYGHVVGDVVLIETAHRLCKGLRSNDLIGRYGGEEFILLLPGMAPNNAYEVAERLRQNVQETPIRTDGGNLEQTISVGLASFPKDATRLHDLIVKADKALYAAKSGGRNRVAV